MLIVGGIYHLWCGSMYPPKHKFLICIDPDQRWFLVVNSLPVTKAARTTQIEVSNYEIPALRKRQSFIDTSELYQLEPDEVLSAVRGEENACRGVISPTLRQRIKHCIESHGVLPRWAEVLVLKNLG